MKKRNRLIVIAGVTTALIVFLIVLQLWGPTFSSAATLTEQEARETVLHRYPGEIIEIGLDQGRYVVKLQLETGLYEIQVDAESGDVFSIVRLDFHGSIEETGELTQEQIESIVQDHASGTIESISKVNEGEKAYYRAVLRMGKQETVVTVDPYSGEVLTSSTSTIDGEEPSQDTVSNEQPSLNIPPSNDQKPNHPPSNDSLPEPEQPPQLLTKSEAAQLALQHIPGEVDDVDWEQSRGTGYYLVEIELDDDREATVQIHAITGEVMSVTWDD